MKRTVLIWLFFGLVGCTSLPHQPARPIAAPMATKPATIMADGVNAARQSLWRTAITRPADMETFAFNDRFSAQLRGQCPRGYEVTDLGRKGPTLNVQFRCLSR